MDGISGSKPPNRALTTLVERRGLRPVTACAPRGAAFRFIPARVATDPARAPYAEKSAALGARVDIYA